MDRGDVYLLVFLAFANAWGIAFYFAPPHARPWVIGSTLGVDYRSRRGGRGRMTRDLEFARTMLTVAKHGLANRLVDHDPGHPRVKDARENVAGWAREVERLERAEDEATLAAGESGASTPPMDESGAYGFLSAPSSSAPAASVEQEESA